MWREQLLDGSLNGIKFRYREIGSSGGRRTVNHQFINSESNFVEDLGKEAESYTVNAFLVGDNYHVTRDQLVSALRSEGTLTFSHPYRGLYPVRLLGQFTVFERDSEGGGCEIQFTLVEDEGYSRPVQATATRREVVNLASKVNLEVEESTSIDIRNAESFSLNSFLDALDGIILKLRTVNGRIQSELGVIDGATNLINEFQDEVARLIDTPNLLLSQLAGLKASIFNLARTVSLTNLDPFDGENLVSSFTAKDVIETVMKSFRDLNVDLESAYSYPFDTAGYSLERQNLRALNLANRLQNVSAVAATLTDLNFPDAEFVESVSDKLVSTINELVSDDENILFSQTLSEAVQNLKSAIIGYLDDVQKRLPELRDVEIQETTPSLVLAYELYGNLDLEDDILERNAIENPAFIPGGETLTVIAS